MPCVCSYLFEKTVTNAASYPWALLLLWQVLPLARFTVISYSFRSPFQFSILHCSSVIWWLVKRTKPREVLPYPELRRYSASSCFPCSTHQPQFTPHPSDSSVPNILEALSIMHNPTQPLLQSPHFDFSAIQKPHKLISHFPLHPTSGPHSSSSAFFLLLTHSLYLPLLWRSCPHLPCSFFLSCPILYPWPKWARRANHQERSTGRTLVSQEASRCREEPSFHACSRRNRSLEHLKLEVSVTAAQGPSFASIMGYIGFCWRSLGKKHSSCSGSDISGAMLISRGFPGLFKSSFYQSVTRPASQSFCFCLCGEWFVCGAWRPLPVTVARGVAWGTTETTGLIIVRPSQWF